MACVTLPDLKLDEKPYISLRIGIKQYEV